MWYIEKSVFKQSTILLSMSLHFFFVPFLGTSYFHLTAGMCLQSQKNEHGHLICTNHLSWNLKWFFLEIPSACYLNATACFRRQFNVKKQRRQMPAEQREWHGVKWPRGSVEGRWPGRMPGAPALSTKYSRVREPWELFISLNDITHAGHRGTSVTRWIRWTFLEQPMGIKDQTNTGWVHKHVYY